MKVQVIPTWGDIERFEFVFWHPITKKKERFWVRTAMWSKKVAAEALDTLQYGYGFNRSNIRFTHQ
jgi:hypothetical protein